MEVDTTFKRVCGCLSPAGADMCLVSVTEQKKKKRLNEMRERSTERRRIEVAG